MSASDPDEKITVYFYIHPRGIKMVRVKRNQNVCLLKQLLPQEMQQQTDYAFYDSELKYIFDYCSFKFNEIKEHDKILLIRRPDFKIVADNKLKYKNSIESMCEKVGTMLLSNAQSIYSDRSFKNEMSRLLDIKKTNMMMKPKVFRQMERDLDESTDETEPTKIPTVVPKVKPTKPSSETIEVKW